MNAMKKPGTKPPKKSYAVYFDQVNQERYIVAARDVQEAIKKAKRLWRNEHSWPTGTHVEEQPDR